MLLSSALFVSRARACWAHAAASQVASYVAAANKPATLPEPTPEEFKVWAGQMYGGNAIFFGAGQDSPSPCPDHQAIRVDEVVVFWLAHARRRCPTSGTWASAPI
eukprot:1161507-Pelagomonas_calceolata.AAC.2